MFANINWRLIIQGTIVICSIIVVFSVIIPLISEYLAFGIESTSETLSEFVGHITHNRDSRLKDMAQLGLSLIFVILVLEILIKRNSK